MLGVAGRHVSKSKESKEGGATQRESLKKRGEVNASSSNVSIGSDGSKVAQRNANGPRETPSKNGVLMIKREKRIQEKRGVAEQATDVLMFAMTARGEELGAEMVQRALVICCSMVT